MKRTLALLAVLLSAVWAVAQQPANRWTEVKDKSPTTRTLTGRVTNTAGQPVNTAVMYLTNKSNMAVKTYIVASDGSYRFPALSRNTDYEIYAQVGSQKSDTKTLSTFDGRTDPVINFHLDVR